MTATLADRFSIPAATFVDAFERCGITHVTTVPDMLQIALHQRLAEGGCAIRTVECTTEDQAVEVAAGVYAGGGRAAILVQNQGFYAALNSVRALGLDARIPLFFVVGQFGREVANLGEDPRTSTRRMVYLLEPLLDTIGVPYWRLESAADAPNIQRAWHASVQQQGPAVLILGHFVGF